MVPSMQVAQQSKTPYQLDLDQTEKACKFLLKELGQQQKQQASTGKPNLLATGDDESDDEPSDLADTPVWLIVSTKKHIVDQKRLKPGKIQLPHSLNLSPATTICLITADPQRTYKDVVADPAFPAELRSRITRVIGIEKLKTKYKSFESCRQLKAEHDIFLADERIVTHLTKLLGKTFYKGGAKRPIPVHIAGQPARDTNGRKVKKTSEEKARAEKQGNGLGAATPEVMAKEIYKSLSACLVMLSPGVSVAVKVGRAAFTAEQCRDNVQAVVEGLVEKYVTKGWRNIRGIHIKGPETPAFPIWLSDELWVDDEDVLQEKPQFGKKKQGQIEGGEEQKLLTGPAGAEVAAKHKRKADAGDTTGDAQKQKKRKPDSAEAKAEAKVEAKVKAELAQKKDKLKKQKAKVMAKVDGSILSP